MSTLKINNKGVVLPVWITLILTTAFLSAFSVIWNNERQRIDHIQADIQEIKRDLGRITISQAISDAEKNNFQFRISRLEAKLD